MDLILPFSVLVDLLEHMFDNIQQTDSPVASGVDLLVLHACINELAQSDQRSATLEGGIAEVLEVAMRRLQSCVHHRFRRAARGITTPFSEKLTHEFRGELRRRHDSDAMYR